MLHFIIGRCGTGKSTLVSDAVVREITHGTRPVVLLVPEQQTVVWETKMASLLPPSANFRIEITNFTRLANSVFRESGGLARQLVDNGTRALLVWRAMLSVWDQLTVYNHCTAGREDRNIPTLLAAVDELKNSGISPKQAEEALKKLENDNDQPNPPSDSRSQKADLHARLSDAVLTYAAYEELLHESYIDRGDLLAELAKSLRDCPYFQGKAVFVDSFFSLTAAEERILFQIFRQADDVTLTFACPPTEKKHSESEQISMLAEESPAERSGEIQFAETEQYLRRASSLAARAGQTVERIFLTENRRHMHAPELAAIEEKLFDYLADLNPPRESPEPARDVQIIACADPADEVQACAAVIDRLLREGYRAGEIAVAARNMDQYEGIADRVLRSHNIPCFLSETSGVSSLPAVRFVLSALAVAANGWQRRDLIRHMKTGLTLVGRTADALPPETDAVPPDADEQTEEQPEQSINTALEGDVLELYTETWNIRGRTMFASGAWSMNPAGYRVEHTPVGDEMLRLANAAREKLVTPLERFLSVFDSGAANVREIAERIVLYAEDCRLDEGLEDAAQSYRKIGMKAEADKVRRSWEKVCEILDCMVTALGDTTLDASRFAGLFSRVASSFDVGSIPTGMDEVLLGSASGVRMDQAKCVIILGAVEGEFPGAVSDNAAFFGERDKIELEGVGLSIGSPDRDIRAARENFMFYRTAASAKDKLYVLTSSPDALSEGALRIEAVLGSMGKSCRVKFADLPAEEIVYHRETAEYLLARRTDEKERRLLRALITRTADSTGAPDSTDHTADQYSAGSSTVAGAQMLLTGQQTIAGQGTHGDKRPRMTLSQSKIESFVQCPFQYWCRYQMKLRPAAKAEITPPDIGNFVHAVLERFFADLPADAVLPLTHEETEARADGIIADYVRALAEKGAGKSGAGSSPLNDGRLSYLFLRLRRHVLVFLEAIMEELGQSAFRPTAFELPIGGLHPDDGKASVKPIVIRTENGTDVTLQGIADRVDVYDAPDGKRYVRVVDYKTGSKSFSLDDVRRGLHVQMLIYLFSLSKNGLGAGTPMIPAGASYFQAKPVSVSESTEPDAETARRLAAERIERSGVFLAEEEILRAMDGEMSGKYLKIKQDKNGNWQGSGKSTSLLSLEELGSLAGELETVIGKIAGEMLEGRADASPLTVGGKDPCTWCEHKLICRVRATENAED